MRICLLIGLTTVFTPHATLAARVWPSLEQFALMANVLLEPLAESQEQHLQILSLEIRFGWLLRAGIHSLSHLLHTRGIMP